MNLLAETRSLEGSFYLKVYRYENGRIHDNYGSPW
jgi:hypothetical protein